MEVLMEATTLHRDRRRDRTTPLASCEARARLAMERGELSRSAYRSLMGITAEVLLLQEQEAGAGDGDGGSSSEKEADAADRRTRITPCDTPPVSREEEEEEEEEEESGPRCDVAVDYEGGPGHEMDFFGDRSRGGRSIGLDSPPSPSTEDSVDADNPDLSRLEKIHERGFGLSSRAARFWQRGENDDGGPSTGDRDGDRRLLRFADVCLEAYPPPATASEATTTSDDAPSESSRDVVAREDRPGPIVEPLRPSAASAIRVDGAGVTRLESENNRWDSRLSDLLRFKAVHGHCNVPFRYEPDKSLGGWVQKQRDLNKRNKLPRARFERLDGAGFSWVLSNKKIPKINDDTVHSYEDLWEMRYNSLVEYRRETGHCDVPYRYAKDAQLGRWVQNQREFYKRRTLSGERYERLNELGFSWRLRKGGKWGTGKRGADRERRRREEAERTRP